MVNAGERNRALTIIKSRGTRHSNQVRELILSENGVTLTDVYTAGGQVLMGTLRWEREAAEQAEIEVQQAKKNRKRSDLELARAEVHARIETLRRELQLQQADLDLLAAEQEHSNLQSGAHQRDLLKMRGADADQAPS